MTEQTKTEQELSDLAMRRLGVVADLIFHDGEWICDPHDRAHPFLKMGFGSTPDEAIEDCAMLNRIALRAV